MKNVLEIMGEILLLVFLLTLPTVLALGIRYLLFYFQS